MKRRRDRPEPQVVSQSADVTELIAPASRVRLGEVLLSQELLTPDTLSNALNFQMESGRQLGAILVEQGLVDPRVLTHALATQLGLPTVDLRKERPTPEALDVVPESFAREFHVLPLRFENGVLDVAVADASDPALRSALASLRATTVNTYLAPAADVAVALDIHYRLVSDTDESIQQLWAASSPEVEVAPQISGGDAPIVLLVNKIVTQALRDRASDIHIEPTDGRMRVRYRIDGSLREVFSLPASAGPELVSRIKIMAEMDIVERRRPQDGQFAMIVDGSGIDVRVATAATIWGEGAVLRILDKKRSLLELADLGMPTDTYERYHRIVHKPYGMIVCSGPTGSGKTTTLYATLAEISRSELNVMTIEDPVEYVFPSVNQMQINVQAGVTFAAGLKSILRQDPDVILVGEIRDEETARIAVQAALTGHLVMSSLHATDASSALFRLLDMGIEPFLVSSSLVGVVGQRLVRRICESCAAPYTPTEAELQWYARFNGPPKEKFLRGTGCAFCSNTGFRERVGVYEVLEVTDGVQQVVTNRGTPQQVRELAAREGMRSMSQEAMTLVANDVTTVDDVARIVYA